MDITKLKKYVKTNYIMIIGCSLILIGFISFHYYVKSYDVTLAFRYINTDILERSIDEEYYIMNKELVFDEEKLNANIDHLFSINGIKVDYSLKVMGNRVTIKIKNQQKEYEISKNTY